MMKPSDTTTQPKKPHQPHDKLVKKLLSNPATAKDILSLYLPADILAVVDLNHLTLQRDSFIDDEHRAFAADLLYQTKIAGQTAYLWLLIEHTRKPDVWLPVRLFKYIALIWDHLRRTGTQKTLPLVYPIVIYNGDHPYPYSLSLQDLIQPDAAKPLFAEQFIKPFHLIDLNTIPDHTLKQQCQSHVQGIALLMTLKYIVDKNLGQLFSQVLIEAYKQLDQAGYRDDLVDMLYYLLNEGKFLNKDHFWSTFNEEFSTETKGKVMTIASELRREGRAVGRVAGIAEGRVAGIAEGRAEEREQVAINLLASGIDIVLIAKVTGLSLDKIKQLEEAVS